MANPYAVPLFSPSIQEVVDDEITEHSAVLDFARRRDQANSRQSPIYYSALLYPTDGDQPAYVDVPLRLGCSSAASPYDCDVTWWIGLGSAPDSSSWDQDATALTITHWPLDDPAPLRRSYTVFCAAQSVGDYRDHTARQPLNSLINSLTRREARAWRGNILVMRSAVHHGTKSKYEMGVEDMTEKDAYLADSIVKSLVQDEVLGRHPTPYFAAAQ